uniref:RecQ-mediated genome instability protein 1 n=1 Tax=Macrostomum lignano TaxID=282301 RepID=A0A1I8IHJ8_9PLAT
VTSNETNGGNFGGGGGGGDRGAGGNWDEPKGGRMLLLTLTDGCAQLRAVECRPMPQLSVGLPPGCKLRLLPPLLIRRGIAMLTSPQSVEVLGGQVDELVVERSQESLLLAALRRLGFEPTDSEQAGPRQPAAAADAANRLFADLDTGNNRPATVENQQQQYQQRNQPDAMATSRNQPNSMSTNWNQPDAMATSRNQPNSMATYRNQPDAMATNRNQSIPPASSSAANNRGASNIRSRPYPDTSAANRGNSLLAGGNNVRDLLGGFDPFEDDEDAAENSAQAQRAQPRQRPQQQSSRQTASGMNPSSSGTSLQRQQSYQQQPQPPRQMSVQEVLDADDLLFAEAIEGIDCDELEAAAVAPSAAASSANRAATSASADRQPLFPSTKRPRMELERHAEGRDIAGIPTSKEPFVYLKDVYTWLEESGPQVREFTVRGYLMGLRGRLEIRDGGYSLPCLLADATCTISCNLGDQVLTDLLGFTAAEADAARRSGDSGTLARCQAALLEMQQQLANMAGLFLLAFDIRQETATAIRFRCVTQADVDALRRRVRARKAQERLGGRQQEAGLAAQDDEFLADWDDGLSG